MCFLGGVILVVRSAREKRKSVVCRKEKERRLVSLHG